MLTCLAVDDEPLALRMLCSHIEKTPFLQLAGAYASALDALHAVREQPVDVLFLDIEMPELTGLELARALGYEAAGGVPAPRVVFTTAYQQFALDGFKVNALDYLLKPFLYEEFLRAALKARAYFDLVRGTAPGPTVAVPAVVPTSSEATMVVKVGNKLVRVAFDDILYMEGLKDYVKVHRASEPQGLLVLSTMRALEEKLPAGRFLRLHRSFIVNLSRVDAVTRHEVQVGKTLVPVSSQYREAFEAFLEEWK